MLHCYVSLSMVTMVVVTVLHYSEREGGSKTLKSGKVSLNASRLGASMPSYVVLPVKGSRVANNLFLNCIEIKPRWQAVRRIFLERKMLAAKDE